MCHLCGTHQKYGSGSGLFYTIVKSDDDDEDDCTDPTPLPTIGDLKKGDAVSVQYSPKYTLMSGWLLEATEVTKMLTRRTRACTRVDWIVQVVFNEKKTITVDTFSTMKVVIKARMGPSFETQPRIDGDCIFNKSLSDLSDAQKQRCDDLTGGGHPSKSKEVLINKFNMLNNQLLGMHSYILKCIKRSCGNKL